MLVQCRLCGHHVNEQDAKDIFEEQNTGLLIKVKVLTGILLVKSMDMPRSICTRCITDLNQSIAFRESCIKTHHLLIRAKDAFDSDTSDILLNMDVDQGSVKQPPKKLKSIVRARTPASLPSSSIALATGAGHGTKSNIVRARIPNSTVYRRITVGRQAPSALPVNVQSQTKARLNPVAATLIDSSSSESSRCSSPILDCESPVSSPSQTQLLSPSPTPSSSVTEKKSITSRPKVAASLVCDQCGRSFDNSSNLKLHLVRHTGIKSFECPECDQKFFTNPLLQMHICVRHKGQKPWICRFCPQGFRTGDSRSRHERKEHYKTKFPCKVCGKSFITKSCLSKHEFLHTGLRPYRCEICNIGFPRNTQLKIHCKSKTHLKNVEDPKKNTLVNTLSTNDDEIDRNEEEFQDLDEIIYEDFDYIDDIIDEDV